VKKIPTIYARDEATNRKFVKDERTPGCEWVFADEGTPTRKYDGTCVLIRRDGLAVHAFARSEVKAGKTPPPNFVEVEHDETTGKTMGWEPATQGPFAVPTSEALMYGDPAIVPGTYELCGPKVNGNPEGYGHHVLIRHADAEVLSLGFSLSSPETFMKIGIYLRALGHEGIVWHHPDGRMAKIKMRDFPGHIGGSGAG
jgi:hypothetical protein